MHFNNGVNSVAIRWRPRLKVWKSSNNVFDPKSMEAKSYDWWTYFAKVNGKNVFNEYYYSSATSHHQSELRKLLKELKIKIHATVSIRESLSDSSIQAALFELYQKQFEQTYDLTRKGISKRRVEILTYAMKERAKEIKAIEKIGFKVTRKKMSELKQLGIQKSDSEFKQRQEERARNKVDNSVIRQSKKELLENSWINVA